VILGRRPDRPAPGDPIGGWCESCGAAYAPGAERCPDCRAPVAFVAPPAALVTRELPDTLDVDGDPIGGWCPSCGGEFVIGIQNCPDCGVALSHEPPPAAALDPEGEAPRSTRHDIVEYDLSDWTPPQFREIERQLEISRIVHEWERMVLRVPGAHGSRSTS